MMMMMMIFNIKIILDQSAEVTEYADCTSAEGSNPIHEFYGYDTKRSGGGVPVILELWGMRSTHTLLLLVRNGST